MRDRPTLADGYFAVPPGKIASVVTCLEMVTRPAPAAASPLDPSLRLERWDRPGRDEYRTLFRAVGEDWLWFSRLVMDDDALDAILRDPRVEVHVLRSGAKAIGLLELDFREERACELAFLGLVADAIGTGAGRALIGEAIDRAWARPIERLWVHTCSFDHARAVDLYMRAGFRPFALMVEIADDPRLAGYLPREAAPRVPLIEG